MAALSLQLTLLSRGNELLEAERFSSHVIRGLSLQNKQISSMYLYDESGSDLYSSITEVEEYYPTGCEMEILQTQSRLIVVNHFRSLSGPEPINVIELGAGDGRKTKLLLKALLKDKISFEYIPIDISVRAMDQLFDSLRSSFKNDSLNVHGIIGEYVKSVKHVASSFPARKTVILFLGTSIGNYNRREQMQLFKDVRSSLNQGDVFFLGADLKKDPSTVQLAYSDSLGVTRDFNLNLLTRMNRELGTDFNLSNFIHYAEYNPQEGVARSFLVAKKAHTVRMNSSNGLAKTQQVKDEEFRFEAYETICTEISRKFTVGMLEKDFTSAGFRVEKKYFDSRQWFVDFIVTVV